MDDRTTLMSPRPLGIGFQIAWYQIREVLHMGGFGITYRAHDKKLGLDVAIREYLPTFNAHRHVNHNVKPISVAHEQHYARGLANFLQVANALASFKHGNIVEVQKVFEQNNTAYMVMRYERGDSLDSIIEQRGTLEQNHQTQIFFPIFNGLRKLHELGFIHRSIKPSNIHIRENGSPVLLDFGSARQTSVESVVESTALASSDYMPPEQYSADYGEQGPWTDIYSIAAIMHHCIAGSKPDEALIRSDRMLRAQSDTVLELSAIEHANYHQQFLSAIHAGLTLQPEFRPQSISQWQALFAGDLEAYERLGNKSKAASTNNDGTRQGSREAQKTSQASSAIPILGVAKQARTKPPNPVSPDTETNTETADMPAGSVVFDESDLDILSAEISAPKSQEPLQTEPKSTPVRTLHKNTKAAACALAAGIVIGVGAFFIQNNRTEQTPTDNNVDTTLAEGSEQKEKEAESSVKELVVPEEVVSGISPEVVTPAATLTTPVTNTSSNNNTASAPVAVVQEQPAAPAQKPRVVAKTYAPIIEAMPILVFNQPVTADDEAASPRTIEQLANSLSRFSPVDGLPDQHWKDKNCSDCHDWTRDSLCVQGNIYSDGVDGQVDRIQHPFGGYFKQALKSWAENGCR